MTNEVEKYKGAITFKEKLSELTRFVDTLNTEPKDEDIEENELIKDRNGNHPLYVPIGAVERKLDELFYGLYNIRILETKVVVNEIMVSVALEIYHPMLNIWLRRDGIGAMQIRMRSGHDITDINGKIKNALQADAPHAYAEAIKNAAKKFGNTFGRNLNRGEDYSVFRALHETILTGEEINNFMKQTDLIDDVKQLEKYYFDLAKNDPKYQDNQTIIRIMSKRKQEIINQKNK